MNKNDLEHKYLGKILAIRLYPHDKNEFFIDDFKDIKILDEVLEEIFIGESDITPAGYSFLKEYFDLNELAKDLFNLENSKTVGNKSYFKKEQDLVNAIQSQLTPMETLSFIEMARGNISDQFTLRDDLLPPSN